MSGYGKRSQQEEATEASADAPVTPHPLNGKVPKNIIDNILKIAGAKPQPIVEGDRSYAGKRSVSDEVYEYGKRSAEGEAAVEGLVTVPLSAVKVRANNNERNFVVYLLFTYTTMPSNKSFYLIYFDKFFAYCISIPYSIISLVTGEASQLQW